MSAYSDLILGHAALRVYYRLGEGSGTTLNDAGPNNLDGTYATSGITYGVAGGIANEADTAVTLDGTSSTAAISRPDDNALDVGDGPWSIELWVKRGATLGTTQTLTQKGTNAFEVRFNTTDQIAVLKSGSSAAATGTASITDTNWHHIVVTKAAGSTPLIYVDGVEGTTANTNHTFADTTALLRLAHFTPTGQRYIGTLDEYALYGAVLTAAEILQHFRVGKGLLDQPSETDLAQPVSRRKTATGGQAAATELALSVSVRKTAPIGAAASSDAAQALGARKQRPIGQAVESELAQTLHVAAIRLAHQVSEASSALAASAAKRRTVGQAAESGESQALLSRKVHQVGQAAEAATAQLLGALKRRSLTQAVESALALAADARKLKAVGQAQETGAAQALGARKQRPIGQAVESELAQTLHVAAIRLAHQVSEASSALAASAAKRRTVGQAAESGESQALLSRKVHQVGQAAEAATAQLLGRRKLTSIGLATEAVAALAVRAVRRVGLAQAAEADTATQLARRKQRSIAAALELDEARATGIPQPQILVLEGLGGANSREGTGAQGLDRDAGGGTLAAREAVGAGAGSREGAGGLSNTLG